MSAVTVNVSLSKHQATLINREIEAGKYASAREVLRDALRLWIEQRIAADLSELERSHAGAWERDTTAKEDAAILGAKRGARTELQSEGKVREPAGRKGRKA